MIKFHLGGDSGAAIRVLCLGAHADDIEIGCGGTILKLLADDPNTSVRWVVFSATPERAQEARDCAESFLTQAADWEVAIESYRDGFFPDEYAEIKKYFEEELKPFRPDLVFTHFRDDRHQDHRVLSDLAWNTFRSHLILEYEILKYDGDLGSPNVFVELEESVAQRKTDHILTSFQSQRRKHWFTRDAFEAIMRIRGIEAGGGTPYAEGFYGRKLLV